MLVTLHIVFLLAVCYFAGFSFLCPYACLLKTKTSVPGIRFVTPILGQAILQLLFWYSYSFSKDSRESVGLLLVLLVFLNVVLLVLLWRNRECRESLQVFFPKSQDLGIFLVCICVFLFSSWPYIALGEGHYFLSGNQDIFDIIAGGRKYLDNVTLGDMNKMAGSGVLRLQYSSNAFWTLILNVADLDAFILSATANLLLTAIGVYWFANYVIGAGRVTATWLSLACVLANFFFSTFVAGHRGSLIYASTAPVLLGGLLLIFRPGVRLTWIVPLAILYHFLNNTYPGPFYFLLIPAILVIIVDRLLRSSAISRATGYFIKQKADGGRSAHNTISGTVAVFGGMLAIVVASLALWVVWSYVQPIRFSALVRTSTPWLIAFSNEIWPMFWGAYPSNIFGSPTPLSGLITQTITSFGAWILTASLTGLTLWAAWLCRSDPKRRFLFVYVCFFALFAVFMRFFFGSSYYFYKFLYVNYFLSFMWNK